MYFIALGIFIVLLFVLLNLFTPGVAIFIDAPSILVVLLFTGTILYASGQFQDFLRSFKIAMSSENTFTKLELKKSLLATNLCSKLLVMSGVLGTFTGGVSILASLGDPSKFGPSLAVAVLTLFYGVIINFMLIPIKAKIKAYILELEN